MFALNSGIYFFTVSGIGDLRNSNDANCTYEGENNVLVQQTSNWLLQVWGHLKKTKSTSNSPLGSINYLSNADQILKEKFNARNVSFLSSFFGGSFGILCIQNFQLIFFLVETNRWKRHLKLEIF